MFKIIQSGFRDADKTLEIICCYINNYCHEKELVRIYIQPWGGEPMLKYKKTLFMYDYFKAHNIYAHIGIMSNGTIVSNETQSFNRVVENIKLLKESVGQDFGTVSVVTANTYDYVERNVDFFVRSLV